jgi:hypothetical protein
VVAAGGVVSAVPGLGSLLQATESDAPEVSAAATDTEIAAADSGGPIVAHLKDLQTGEISLYQGEREFTLNDRAMAAKLFRAAH